MINGTLTSPPEVIAMLNVLARYMFEATRLSGLPLDQAADHQTAGADHARDTTTKNKDRQCPEPALAGETVLPDAMPTCCDRFTTGSQWRRQAAPMKTDHIRP